MASCCHSRKLSSVSLKDTGFEKVCGENAGEEDVDEAGEAGEEEGGAIVEVESAMDRKKSSRYHVRFRGSREHCREEFKIEDESEKMNCLIISVSTSCIYMIHCSLVACS